MKKISRFLFGIIGTAVVFFAGATVSERLVGSISNWHYYLIVAIIVLAITALFYSLGRGSKAEEFTYDDEEDPEE